MECGQPGVFLLMRSQRALSEVLRVEHKLEDTVQLVVFGIHRVASEIVLIHCMSQLKSGHPGRFPVDMVSKSLLEVITVARHTESSVQPVL